MNSPTILAENSSGLPANGRAGAPEPLRLALICDLLEEGWPSMDLIGDMLYRSFHAEHAAAIRVEQLRPPLRRRLSAIPALPVKGPRWNADRLLNRFYDYPAWVRKRAADYDVFHIVDHSYSQLILELPAERTVVTCHDLDTFRCVLEPERDPRPRWFRAMVSRILDGFRRAAHVLTVSQATRDELLSHRIFPPDRVTVVPNGVDPSCSPLPDPAADREADRLLESPPGTLWLLNVGNTLPRKRLDILVRACAAIQRQCPEVRLVRVGGLTAEHLQLAASLNLKLLCLPYLGRDVLAALYRRAALLVHTAEAEGFGLPLVEAMACGCPIVVSDLAVLREVGGPAAEYCPVADLDAWRNTVKKLLQEKLHNPDQWALRREAGIAHAARFSWSENARQTAQVYRNVLELQTRPQSSERKSR
jgi:glycosyltransferase involved in cell wall biosynthesis